MFGKKTGQDIRDNKKTYLYLKALETGAPAQRERLQALFSTTPAQDDDKVQEVLGIYQTLAIRQKTEAAIQEEFSLAEGALAAIQVDEQKKSVLRQLTETLLNRDK